MQCERPDTRSSGENKESCGGVRVVESEIVGLFCPVHVAARAEF